MRILFLIIKSGKSRKIPLLFQWLMIGFPMMIWQTISEAYQVTLYFWFAKKLLAEENKGVSNLSYHFLAKTLTEMYKKQMSICEFHQLIEFLNQEEKNTPIRVLEKSSVFKNLCNIFQFKTKNSPMGFSTATPYMGTHQKYNAYDIIKHHAIRDPELLLEFLGKFSIVTREIDEISNEKKKIVILPIRNILKLMKWYNKTSLRLANYQLLYDIIRKIES